MAQPHKTLKSQTVGTPTNNMENLCFFPLKYSDSENHRFIFKPQTQIVTHSNGAKCWKRQTNMSNNKCKLADVRRRSLVCLNKFDIYVFFCNKKKVDLLDMHIFSALKKRITEFILQAI